MGVHRSTLHATRSCKLSTAPEVQELALLEERFELLVGQILRLLRELDFLLLALGGGSGRRRGGRRFFRRSFRRSNARRSGT